MKKINIAYWVFTVLFGGFMIFSAIPDIMMVPEAVAMIGDGLGYPKYIIPFLGWAKLSGVITILIPGLNKVKEWAYAGLFFDLVGAMYSALTKFGWDPKMLIMLLPFICLFGSYFLWHKRKGTL